MPVRARSQTMNTDQILVFVSFSMPREALQQLSESAEKHNAVLVMRGLHDNSFVKTAAKIQDLGAGGIEINPELFTRYRIQEVPVFVLIQNNQEIARLKGNVTLDFAAQKLRGLS